ncbi:MAG: hypothetical protein LBB49_05015 [Gracilibacteraceae bacterium]|jgi:hypothetical protein|nr:hypothetical protein [Gracilibacteraceae bacterium]
MRQQNVKTEYLLAEMLELLKYLPQLTKMQMVTDTGALVGALAPGMNTMMGQMDRQRARGGTWHG